jgi:hypothetical protein
MEAGESSGNMQTLMQGLVGIRKRGICLKTILNPSPAFSKVTV